MKTLIKNLFAIVLLIANITLLQAQNNSSNDVNIKMQLMKMDDKFYIFLTDEKGIPYENKDITATGKVRDTTGKNKAITLSRHGETSFVINESIGKFSTLKATLHLENNKYHVIFYGTFYGKGKNEIMYQCPMHPDEMMDKEGKCPKCGKSLVAKKISVYHPEEMIRKGSR